LGAHAVLLLAVSEKPFQQACEYARSRGTIVSIAMPAGAFLKAPVFDTVVKMISIKGSYVGNRQDGVEAVDFYARGLIKAPFKTVPLKELPEVFKLMGTLPIFPFINTPMLTCYNRTRQDCWPLRSRNARIDALRFIICILQR
jgi:D-arabinose 1-dehydrogenase-like Zn-dependent alcohol dehydrogenase